MISSEAKQKIQVHIASLPDELRSEPATEAELEEFEAVYGAIPEDYRWFLATCGGGVFGPEYVDDIERLLRSHEKFRGEFGPPRGWTMENVFIIGWDGGGNPFGIEKSTGQILVEDHDFGGIHEMAPSLQDFMLKGVRG
jgi:hypothetical protein